MIFKFKPTRLISVILVLFFPAFLLLASVGCKDGGGSQAKVSSPYQATEAELRLYHIAISAAPLELYSRVDYLTSWVYEYSVHKAEKSPFETIVDVEAMAKAILAFIDGTAPKPNLQCSHRANILKTILQIDGKRARLFNLLGNGTPDDHLYGHVFLEFWDPSRGEWIIADPDVLAYWVANGRRIGVAEAIRLDYESIVPCNLQGKCSYLIANSEKTSPKVFIRLGLFSAALEVSEEWNKYSYTHFYVNAKKVDPNKPIEGQSLLQRFGSLPRTIFN